MTSVTASLVTFVHYDFKTRMCWKVDKIKLQIMFRFFYRPPKLSYATQIRCFLHENEMSCVQSHCCDSCAFYKLRDVISMK